MNEHAFSSMHPESPMSISWQQWRKLKRKQELPETYGIAPDLAIPSRDCQFITKMHNEWQMQQVEQAVSFNSVFDTKERFKSWSDWYYGRTIEGTAADQK